MSAQLAPGCIVAGRYTIQDLVARHPWGVTYRAMMAPNREIVLKAFDRDAVSKDTFDEITRAKHAVDTVPAHLALQLLDAGHDPAVGAFVVTESSTHPSLAQLVALCVMSPPEMVRITRSLARALDAVHGAKSLHLALDPTSIFVGPLPDQRVQLSDFGAATMRRKLREEQWLPRAAPWIAPEQLTLAAAPAPATDVFTAALIAFFSMTGRSFWRSCAGTTPELVAWREEIATAPRVASARAAELGVSLPSTLDEAFARALAIDPAARFTSAGELAQALEDALAGVTSRPSSVISVAAVPAPAPPTLRPPPQPSAPDAAIEWSELARPNRARTMRAMAIGGGAGLALSLLGVILAVSARARPAPEAIVPSASTSTPVAAVPPPVPSETVAPAPTTPPAVPARALGNEAELAVVCEPACALVMIDGKRMKSYPKPARVHPGRHGVGVARPGYAGNWKLVTLARGQSETVSFKLTPARK
jgi:hypothetical protein